MHTVTVKLIADQIIEINGHEVNIHDLRSIELDGNGRIVCYTLVIPAAPILVSAGGDIATGTAGSSHVARRVLDALR